MALAVIVALVVEMAAFAALNVLPRSGPTKPVIWVEPSAIISGCRLNSTGNGTLNWTVRYSSLSGPDAYAIMSMSVGARLVRYWSEFVPSGARYLTENGTLTAACDQFNDFLIRLVDTVAA